MNYPYNMFGAGFGNPLAIGIFSIGTILLMAWTLYWKGLALWKSARLHDKTWFIILLVVNTVGILEIIYIYWISPKRGKTTLETAPVETQSSEKTPEEAPKI